MISLTEKQCRVLQRLANSIDGKFFEANLCTRGLSKRIEAKGLLTRSVVHAGRQRKSKLILLEITPFGREVIGGITLVED